MNSIPTHFYEGSKPPRLDFYVGSACNVNCIFCFDGDLKKRPQTNKKTSSIKRQLTLLRKQSNRVLFIGGEASIRPDFIDIVSHAKKLGYDEIGIVTNGIAFADMGFCKNIFDAGLNNVSVSLHSVDECLTVAIYRKDNIYMKLLEGVQNIGRFSKTVNIDSNTVVNRLNYKYLKRIAKFLFSVGIQHQNYGFLEYAGEAKEHMSRIGIRYSDVQVEVNELIGYAGDMGVDITVDYPYCLLSPENIDPVSLSFGSSVAHRVYGDVIAYANIKTTLTQEELNKFESKGIISSKCIQCKYLYDCKIPKRTFFNVYQYLDSKYSIELGQRPYIQIFGDSEFHSIEN